MKILKDKYKDKCLMLGGCEIESYIEHRKRSENKEVCLVKFYGGSGAFGSSFSEIQVDVTYETMMNFLASNDNALECSFNEFIRRE